MPSLRARMARHGFESNDDYEYRVRCLMSYPARGLRCLSVEGESGRRKTAFATALARALDWDHVLYHDFTATEPLPGRVEVPDHDDEEGQAPVQLTVFDRTLSEACALSEADATVLIVDQLQEKDRPTGRKHEKRYFKLHDATILRKYFQADGWKERGENHQIKI